MAAFPLRSDQGPFDLRSTKLDGRRQGEVAMDPVRSPPSRSGRRA